MCKRKWKLCVEHKPYGRTILFDRQPSIVLKKTSKKMNENAWNCCVYIKSKILMIHSNVNILFTRIIAGACSYINIISDWDVSY